MIDLKRYNVVLELTEDLLGTCPKSKEVYSNYIAAKGRELIEKAARKGGKLSSGAEATGNNVAAALADEVDTITDIEEKGSTGFHQDKDGIFIYDYSVRGFLCEAARTLKERPGAGASKKGAPDVVKQLQDKVKRYCFVFPRKIRLPPVSGVNERPLRGMTAQGPRVTVTSSDTVAAGTRISFELKVLEGGGVSKAILRDILDYGQFQGLGQWRSGGFGRFNVVEFGLAD